jgi:hypothetical protein
MAISNSYTPALWRGFIGPDSEGFIGVSFDFEDKQKEVIRLRLSSNHARSLMEELEKSYKGYATIGLDIQAGGVMCISNPYQPTEAELETLADENSVALEELMARKFFVDDSQNIIPADGLKEGMPCVWSDKAVTLPVLPDGYDGSSEMGFG